MVPVLLSHIINASRKTMSNIIRFTETHKETTINLDKISSLENDIASKQ